MTAAIQINQVEKSYKALKALGGVSLTIEQGEFFGLLGPNGAGKTTLISTIAGLIRPDAGNIAIHGHDVVTDFRNARKNLGVVPQELVFDPFFTVRETLRLQSGYFGLKNNDKWIDEVMENLDLTGKADANMRALSGGMKRRVLVAQALVHKPPVIVLDEPTAGVDVELRQGLWKFISAAEPRRSYGRAHHPLPGRGASHVQPGRHAARRKGGGARHHEVADPPHFRLAVDRAHRRRRLTGRFETPGVGSVVRTRPERSRCAPSSRTAVVSPVPPAGRCWCSPSSAPCCSA